MIKKYLVGISVSLLVLAQPILASGGYSGKGGSIAGIPIEFIFFGLTLLGVALFHHHTLKVALTGLAVVLIYKFLFASSFNLLHHFFGEGNLITQITDKHSRSGEWSILLNLFGLLVGFSILAKLFEDSGVPEILPKILPDDWKGPLVLLVIVFFLSSFLDNIAAAMIGGSIALIVFRGKVHIGYLAAIVASSNAGGAGSVLGDTTTTMMWIEGVSAFSVLHAYIASVFCFLGFAFFASKQQDKFQKIVKDGNINTKIDYSKLFIVALILIGTILTNILFDFPALGVWAAILAGSLIRKMPWEEAKHSLGGSLFLLALVMCASLMSVDQLPPASWQSAFSLGFISSVFDNIPLTKLALDQGGYDWGVLAYAVGFGGSMIWFGSSAGVAITNKFPEGKSVINWLKNGWHIVIGYIIGFIFIMLLWGWHPDPVSNNHPKDKIEVTK